MPRALPSLFQSRAIRALGALLGISLATCSGLFAQEGFEFGPLGTREMFPLYLISMSYQPADPTPLGQGQWRITLDHMQANTFEFSDVFKDQTPRDAQGRMKLTRAYVEAHASE